MEVNGQSLLEMSIQEADAILNSLQPGEVKLQIMRPHTVDALKRLIADRDSQSLGRYGEVYNCKIIT